MSLREIAELLGVSKSSVSLWVREIRLSNEQQVVLGGRRASVTAAAEWNRAHAALRRDVSRRHGRQRAVNATWLYVAGVMLYWGEGEKSNHTLGMVNSDPNMMRLWMRFMREELSVADDRITLTCGIHADHNRAEVEAFWLQALDLPSSSLRTTFVRAGGTTPPRRRLPHGTARVRVHSTALVEEVLGALEILGDFKLREWKERRPRSSRKA